MWEQIIIYAKLSSMCIGHASLYSPSFLCVNVDIDWVCEITFGVLQQDA